MTLAVVALIGCTSAGGQSRLPIATPAQFDDLPSIVEHAKQLATSSGDSTPRGVSIVRSTLAAVYGPSDDPGRDRQMYFVRMDGDFKGCPSCHGQPDASFGPTRWMSFDWDPQQHLAVGFGFGSAPHLEQFGPVYALALG